MTQQETVSPHDCVGSNLYAHVLRGTVKRIVPRDNESINEAWISDRDRFSYEAIYSPDRLTSPRIKDGGQWRDIEWGDALAHAADVLTKADSEKLGFISSSAVTVEESFLLSRLANHLGTANIDHRVGRRDTSDQADDPVFEALGCGIDEIENKDAVLVVGSNLRSEAPIIAHRLRKAALKGGQISFANSSEYEFYFDVANYASGKGLVELLAGIAVAAGVKSETVGRICAGVNPDDTQTAIAASLNDAEDALVLLGRIAGFHAAYSAVRALAAAIAEATGAKIGFITSGPNAAGASLAGVLPHREIGGKGREKTGLGVSAMLENELDAVVLVNVEPDADIHATTDAVSKLGKQEFVIALTPFVSYALLEVADLLLPIGTFAETSGTYVNVAGTWQSFAGVAKPVGESRPCWKVLRVLGNLTDADGFEYVTSEDVLNEFKSLLGDVDRGSYAPTGSMSLPNGEDSPADEIDTPIYSVDGLVRRAPALQLTLSAKRAPGSD